MRLPWYFASIFLVTAIPSSAGILISSPGGSAATMNFTTFATGLSFAIGMTSLPSGNVIVGTTTRPASVSASFENYFYGSGKVLKFADANNDGVADGPAQVIYSAAGAVTGVASAGDFLVVSTTGAGSAAAANRQDLLILAPSGGGNFTSLGSLRLDMPNPYNNMTVASAAAGGGSYYVYFHVASGTHEGAAGPDVSVTGLLNGTVQGGSIYRITVDPSNAAVPVSGLTQIARGIRNLGGMNVAANGDLFFTDNGWDINLAAVSADELNRVPAASLGGSVIDFGYASNYIDYNTGLATGSNGLAPVVAFIPSGGKQRIGISGSAEAPGSFPVEMQDGEFVSFHGDFYRSGVNNVLNPVVFYSRATNTYFDLVAAGQAGLGNIDSLMSTNNALFLADFTSGVAFQPDTGIIYRLAPASIPEPSTAVLVFVALAAISRRVKLRNYSAF